MGRISIVINTYNAERDLRQVLESVKEFDEIVVCDMESTDRTLEIAKEYGCKIVTFPKGDYTICEPARQFAIQSAQYEWVFVVDADEIVTKELREYLYQYIESDHHQCGLFVPRMNYVMGCFMKSSYPDYQLRFLKREGTVWPPYIHSVPMVDGPTEKIPKDRRELALIHLSSSVYSHFQKFNDYTENEVKRRKDLNITYAKMLFSPAFRFFKSYILKGGFRYGKIGLIQSVHNAIYKFVVMEKVLEAQNKEDILNKR